MKLTVGSLFTGIGGIDLGLERAGMEIKWQVENDEFCTHVLEKHWPTVRRFTDVRELSSSSLEAVDVICGGFPCQPVSVAGRREAQADNRWLWPEFARVVDELRPEYVIVENVPGLYSAGGVEVVLDLAALGFDAKWHNLLASAFGAPHQRERFVLVGHANQQGLERRRSERQLREFGEEGHPRGAGTHEVADSDSIRLRRERVAQYTSIEGPSWDFPDGRGEGGRRDGTTGWWEVEPDVGRVADGVPRRMDRLKGLGNAVVPQMFEWVGRMMQE
jgi:DNA (cytosine-5)-methyltransferase 1